MPAWIETAIANLLNTKGTIIDAAYQQKGGWEGWAQVEIAISLAATVPNNTVLREPHPYPNPGDKADVLLTITEPLNGQHHYEILELKCWGQLRKKGEFIKQVEIDIDKILTTANVVNTRAWAMVLVPDAAVKNDIKNAMLAKRRQSGATLLIKSPRFLTMCLALRP
ncbi:hypothetical protein BKA70DRAFT_52725 [Coprinopsis sp. MPI-PUGE-AT-0042]|nr:hypothetical protein BKA70DRAFT_52725 [Coprinopsis sp. MPI-PUGE-AT-0042]